MKKLIIILAMCMATSVLAQNSFPTENAIWSIRYTFQGMSNHEPDFQVCYGLIGDTVINSFIYNKLYSISDTVLSEENRIHYFGGFRNEGQKVFFRPNSLNYTWNYPDILLFDFEISVGDTVCHGGVFKGDFQYCNDYDDNRCTTIIYKIDTINGIKRVNDDWLEGIGGYGGFFKHISVYPVGDHYVPYLDCLKHNDIIIYPNQISPDDPCHTCPCNGIVGIKENITSQNSYLYQNQPNPFSKSTEIKYFIFDNAKQISLIIYDMQGALIKQISIYDKGESKIIINANELQPGVYIYQLVIDGKDIDSKKMILTK